MILQKATVKRAKTFAGALRYLEQNTPNGIVVTDAGVVARSPAEVRECREISDRLVTYVHNGGTVIFSFVFSSHVSPAQMNKFWQETWNLPWKFGDYHRTTFHLNRDALKLDDGVVEKLQAAYSQKAVHLKGVAREHAWYLPGTDSTTQTFVFPTAPIQNMEQTPMAFAKVGEGFVGYTGDVNQEEGTNLALMQMLGLK
jgi:hypothetical protein